MTRTFAVVPGGMFEPASDTSTGDEGGVWNSTSGVLTFPLGVGGTVISPTDVIRRVGVLAGVTAPRVATTVPVESFKNKLKFEASPSIRTVPPVAADCASEAAVQIRDGVWSNQSWRDETKTIGNIRAVSR